MRRGARHANCSGSVLQSPCCAARSPRSAPRARPGGPAPTACPGPLAGAAVRRQRPAGAALSRVEPTRTRSSQHEPDGRLLLRPLAARPSGTQAASAPPAGSSSARARRLGQPARRRRTASASTAACSAQHRPARPTARPVGRTATVPYLGVGYTGLRHAAAGASAPTSAWWRRAPATRSASAVFGGGQSLDDIVRDMRLAPLSSSAFRTRSEGRVRAGVCR